MKDKKLNLILLIVFGLIIGVFIYFSDSSNKKEKQDEMKQERIQEEKYILREKKIQEIKDKYNAKDNWDNELKFTSQLQKVILQKQPILLEGVVLDVFYENNKSFISVMDKNFNSNYVAILQCDRSISERIEKLNKEQNYIFVVNIRSITKPLFSLKSSMNYSSEESVEIINTEDSNTFLLNGECVDVIPMNTEEFVLLD